MFSNAMIAGVLLLARVYLQYHGLAAPGIAEILRITGVGQTRAYACRKQLRRILGRASRPVGRPAAATEASAPTIEARVLSFLMEHPGAVTTCQSRRHYSDGFRRFILELRAEYAAVERSAFARAAQIPLSTLKQWERHTLSGTSSGERSEPGPAAPSTTPSTAPETSLDARLDDRAPGIPRSRVDSKQRVRIPRLIAAWRTWDGSFSGFCAHARDELGIDAGRTWIGDILDAVGERPRRSRASSRRDAHAIRDSFETFFPGAQWVGDGTALTVEINGQRFRFNLELIVDVDTGALVGASVRDQEDSDAVIRALDDGQETTGEAPMALLLDRRSCNRSQRVRRAMKDTLLLHATPGRPQNKAHVEGAFGLFSQTMPPLEIAAETPRQLARRVLELTVQAWARILNHRPQPDHGGTSRVQRYREGMTTRARRRARRLLRKRRVNQGDQPSRSADAATAATWSAERWIEDGFARLGIRDATGRILPAIARYPLDAILGGISTYEGKRDAGTLPDNVARRPGLHGARYLLGLVRTIADHDEGMAISRALWGMRRLVRGELIGTLDRCRAAILAHAPTRWSAVARLIDRAVTSELQLERLYWLDAAAQEMQEVDRSPGQRAAELACPQLFEHACRRILASHALSRPDRLQAMRFLASRALPIA